MTAARRAASDTDEEHYTELERLADGLHVSAIIVDPSAASFIEVIRRHDRYRVEKASNSVLDGIPQCGDPAPERLTSFSVTAARTASVSWDVSLG